MSSIRFLVRSESGEVSGPITAQELAQMALSGAIRPSCMIQREQGTSWHPAGKVKGLVFPVAEAALEIDTSPTPRSPSLNSPRRVPPPIPQHTEAVAPALAASPDSSAIPGGLALAGIAPAAMAAASSGASTKDQFVQAAKSIPKAIPALLIKPISGVVELSSKYSTAVLLVFAAIFNVLFSMLAVGSLCFVFRRWLQAGDIAEVLAKGVLTLLVSCTALAAANFGIRKLALPESRLSYGFDAVVAVTAMWPIQIALAILMLAGLSQVTVSVVLLSILLAVLILYAVNVTQSPRSPNLVLFLTPVQVVVAGVLSNLLFEGLLPEIGKLVKMV